MLLLVEMATTCCLIRYLKINYTLFYGFYAYKVQCLNANWFWFVGHSH